MIIYSKNKGIFTTSRDNIIIIRFLVKNDKIITFLPNIKCNYKKVGKNLFQVDIVELGLNLFAKNRRYLVNDLENELLNIYEEWKDLDDSKLSEEERKMKNFLFEKIEIVSNQEIIKENIIIITNGRYGVKHCLSFPSEKFCRFTTDSLCKRHINQATARIKLGTYEEITCESCKGLIRKYKGENVKRQQNASGKIYRGYKHWLK